MNQLRWGVRLLLIHVFFIVIVWLASYFSPLDILFAGAYLVIIWKASQIIARESPSTPLWTAGVSILLGQLPGLLLTAANLYSYVDSYSILSDCRFAFQLWHTSFMPFLSFLSFPVSHGYIFYYWALNFVSPFYLVIFLLSARIEKTGVKLNDLDV